MMFIRFWVTEILMLKKKKNFITVSNREEVEQQVFWENYKT